MIGGKKRASFGLCRGCCCTSWVGSSPRGATSFLNSPLLLGLVLGFLLNLTTRQDRPPTVPDIDTSVEEGSKESFFEPFETNNQVNLLPAAKEATFSRPKYLRDEMPIAKKILLAVILEDTALWLYEKYVNETVVDHVDHVTYFAASDSSNSKTEDATNQKTILLPVLDIFSVVQYLAEKHEGKYRFYYIINSKSLVNGRLLQEFYTALQFEERLFLGVPDTGPGCPLEAGIFLSNDILTDLKAKGNECERNKVFSSSQQEFTQCIEKLSQVRCEGGRGSQVYSALPFSRYSAAEARNSVLLVHGIEDEAGLNTALLLQFQTAAEQMRREAAKLSTEITQFVASSSYDLKSDWPEEIFVQELELDRYDRDVALYFNSTHIFNTDSYEDASRLTATHIELLQDIRNKCADVGEGGRITSGWRKSDLSVGTTYQILIESVSEEKKVKVSECSAFSQLGDPRILSLPFVTETSRISLVVPVSELDTKQVLVFLRNFDRNALERGDRVLLMLVFLYTPERREKNNNNDFYKEVKQTALLLSKKYKRKDNKGSHILWYSMQLKDTSPPSPLELVDLVVQKLDNSIILLGSVEMEVHADYLNRVRMNTIPRRMVFSPIPFTEYHPQVVYGTKKSTVATINFDANTGTFETLNFEHLSFYKDDYWTVRKRSKIATFLKEENLIGRNESRRLPAEAHNLPQLFSQYGRPDSPQDSEEREKEGESSTLHLLRAPEPSLRLRYKKIDCSPNLPEKTHSICVKRQSRSIGSRKQLAELYLNSQTPDVKLEGLK